MARVVVLCLMLLAQTSFALSGSWKFTDMIYKNQRVPRPSPDLNLVWTFFENGTERLYWDRGDNTKFCERFAFYTVKNQQIIEETFALNPKNAFDCAKDPDMKVGNKTQNPISFHNNEIWIHLDLSGEEIVYILLPVDSDPDTL